MRLQARTDHAIQLLLYLSQFEKFQNTMEIAKEARLTGVYLHHILSSLQKAGLLETKRGPTGGCRLRKAPWSITLYDVMEATDRTFPMGCCPASTAKPTTEASPAIYECVRKEVLLSLRRITLADLADQLESSAANTVAPTKLPRDKLAWAE